MNMEVPLLPANHTRGRVLALDFGKRRIGLAVSDELGVTAPDSPMYLYHSKTDDVIPVAGFSALVDRYCSMGATLTAIHSVFPTHNGAAAGEALGGMNYLADRFAGRPVTPGCTIR